MPVRGETALRRGRPGRDVELEHVAITSLQDVCRLLGDHRDERDRGTPDLANRALRIPCRQLHDEDLVFRPSRIQAQQRARFVARLGETRQEVRFRLLGDPARIGHQVGELGNVRGECRSRGDTMTSFVEIPAHSCHGPIVATGRRNKAHRSSVPRSHHLGNLRGGGRSATPTPCRSRCPWPGGWPTRGSRRRSRRRGTPDRATRPASGRPARGGAPPRSVTLSVTYIGLTSVSRCCSNAARSIRLVERAVRDDHGDPLGQERAGEHRRGATSKRPPSEVRARAFRTEHAFDDVEVDDGDAYIETSELAIQRTSDGALATRDRSGDHDDHEPVRPFSARSPCGAYQRPGAGTGRARLGARRVRGPAEQRPRVSMRNRAITTGS